MSENHENPSKRSLSFHESLRFLRDHIKQMRDLSDSVKETENRVFATGKSRNDTRYQHDAEANIFHINNTESLYLIALYVLELLEAQEKVNQELLGHINIIRTAPIPPATIGEIVKSGLDQLEKEAEQKARKLAKSVYS